MTKKEVTTTTVVTVMDKAGKTRRRCTGKGIGKGFIYWFHVDANGNVPYDCYQVGKFKTDGIKDVNGNILLGTDIAWEEQTIFVGETYPEKVAYACNLIAAATTPSDQEELLGVSKPNVGFIVEDIVDVEGRFGTRPYLKLAIYKPQTATVTATV